MSEEINEEEVNTSATPGEDTTPVKTDEDTEEETTPATPSEDTSEVKTDEETPV